MPTGRSASLVSAVVPAAGGGTRFGGAKLWVNLGGQPVLAWALRALGEPASGISELIVVTDPRDHRRVLELSSEVAPRLGCRCVAGGSRRQESVARGLEAASGEVVAASAVLIWSSRSATVPTVSIAAVDAATTVSSTIASAHSVGMFT